MRILAIGAHPDDIEYSCFGFLRKMKKAEHPIFMLILSAGEKATESAINERIREQEIAYDKSGFDGLFIQDYPDGDIPCNLKVVSTIGEYIQSLQIDLVLTHYPDDYHQDHRNVSMATIAACRNVRNVMYYQSYSALNFTPEVYVPIDEEIVDKRDVLNCFSSQITKNQKKSIDFISCSIETNKYYGTRSYSAYAEGYRVHRIII